MPRKPQNLSAFDMGRLHLEGNGEAIKREYWLCWIDRKNSRYLRDERIYSRSGFTVRAAEVRSYRMIWHPKNDPTNHPERPPDGHILVLRGRGLTTAEVRWAILNRFGKYVACTQRRNNHWKEAFHLRGTYLPIDAKV